MVNNKNKKYIEEITTVENNFAWNELNCFYRPFAIVFNSINKQYFQSFLLFLSMYVSYVLEDETQLTYNKSDIMFDYFNVELQSLFHSRIQRFDIKKTKDFHKLLKEELSEQRPVILPCDLYYLPYSENYRELHKRHYLIIKGYDSKKQIYYILDNMHNELGASTRYSDFMMEEKIVYEMNYGFSKCFDRIPERGYFWSVDLHNNGIFFDESIRYLAKACNRLVNGNKYQNFERKLLDEIRKDVFTQNTYGYLLRSNIRTLFLCSLVNYLLNYTKDKRAVSDIEALCQKISKEWDIIKQSIIYKIQKRNDNVEKIQKRVENNIEQEKRLFAEIINYISSISLETEQNLKLKDHRIQNRNQAVVSVAGDRGEILLSKEKIYDTWEEKNNAPQILYDVKTDEGEFKIRINIDTQFGSSSMCGIILYLEDETRIMYGSLGRMNLGIHIPSDGADYEHYLAEEVVENALILGILWEENKCIFYIGDDKGKKKIKKELPLCEKIKQTGIFAKTWEHTECNLKFEIIENIKEKGI